MKKLIFLLICLATLIGAWRMTVAYAGRCNDSIVYTQEIPVEPGVRFEVPLEDDEVVCTTFMYSEDGQEYHFGFDVWTECQDGYCVQGTDYGPFTFWWEVERPVEVVVWYRDYWPEETPKPPTSTPVRWIGTITVPTTTPTPGSIISPPNPIRPTVEVYLPMILEMNNARK